MLVSLSNIDRLAFGPAVPPGLELTPRQPVWHFAIFIKDLRVPTAYGSETSADISKPRRKALLDELHAMWERLNELIDHHAVLLDQRNNDRGETTHRCHQRQPQGHLRRSQGRRGWAPASAPLRGARRRNVSARKVASITASAVTSSTPLATDACERSCKKASMLRFIGPPSFWNPFGNIRTPLQYIIPPLQYITPP